MSATLCCECGTATCHRTPVNPYCSTQVYATCPDCKRRATVRGAHDCVTS